MSERIIPNRPPENGQRTIDTAETIVANAEAEYLNALIDKQIIYEKSACHCRTCQQIEKHVEQDIDWEVKRITEVPDFDEEEVELHLIKLRSKTNVFNQ